MDGIRKLIALSLRDIYERSGRVWGEAELGKLLRGLFGPAEVLCGRVWGGQMSDDDCGNFGAAIYRALLFVRCAHKLGGVPMGLGEKIEEQFVRDYTQAGLVAPQGSGENLEKREEVAPPGEVAVASKPMRGYVANADEVAREFALKNKGGGGVAEDFLDNNEGVRETGAGFNVSDVVNRSRMMQDEGLEEKQLREREGKFKDGDQLFDFSKGRVNKDIYMEGSGARIVPPTKPDDETLVRAEIKVRNAPPPGSGHF